MDIVQVFVSRELENCYGLFFIVFIDLIVVKVDLTQQAHDVVMTWQWHRSDVTTSHRPLYDIIWRPCVLWACLTS